ncbi:MAG: DUF4198 domain-containing protein [Candidatus Eisenbacteria bacterium]|nr:DUF4198 domain-containing protein [Candidatus Eisenbacteria bacterium]
MVVVAVFSACLVFLLGAPAPAEGHLLWLQMEGSGLTIYHGHPPGLGLDSSSPKEVPIENVLRASCFEESGNGAALDSVGAYPIDFGGPCAAASALVSSGYWTKTPYGTKNVPKNEAESPISSWLSYESVKHLATWSDAFAAPLTGDLEIVPLHDPFSLDEGDKLRLLVTIEGKPAAGAIVVYDGKPRGETDSEGHVNVKIRRSGLQMILASHRTPLQSEKADEIVRTAVLSFALEEKP